MAPINWNNINSILCSANVMPILFWHLPYTWSSNPIWTNRMDWNRFVCATVESKTISSEKYRICIDESVNVKWTNEIDCYFSGDSLWFYLKHYRIPSHNDANLIRSVWLRFWLSNMNGTAQIFPFQIIRSNQMSCIVEPFHLRSMVASTDLCRQQINIIHGASLQSNKLISHTPHHSPDNHHATKI